MVSKNKPVSFARRRLARERASPPGEAALAPRVAVRDLPPRAASSFLTQASAVRQAARHATSGAPCTLHSACLVDNRPHDRSRERRAPAARRSDVIVVRSTTAPPSSSKRTRSIREPPPEAEDVIDLGAPRTSAPAPTGRLKPPRSYIPNARLYPGPGRGKPRDPPKRADARGGGEGRGRRRKRASRRAVPNPRLYRPAPRREPPPAYPRTAWQPPAPAARLDTASRAALHLSEQRRGPNTGPPPSSAGSAQQAPLVLTLPSVTDAAPRYKPLSEHFRLCSLDTESGESTPVAGRPSPFAASTAPTMDAGNRKSASPEDCSDGNETLSAPSEFLAEFLSAIMRRQYAEALKYCRLILQYEPHNATARGFYPLLQQKVQAQKRPDEDCLRGSSSEESERASAAAETPPRRRSVVRTQDDMEQGGDSSSEAEEGGASRSGSRASDSCRSQSSLELDSSEALAQSSPSPSLSLSRRTERTEHTDSASGGAWGSSGSASRSDTDDNGNATAASAPAAAARLRPADLENDNAPAAPNSPDVTRTKNDTVSALRRLRAQFTCSIK